MRTALFFRSPSNNATDHAARTLLLLITGPMLLVFALPFSAQLLSSLVPRDHSVRAVFTAIGIWSGISLLLLGSGLLLAWWVGNLVDHRASYRLRRMMYYCSNLWVVLVGAAGVAWSLHRLLVIGRFSLHYAVLIALFLFVALSTIEPVRKWIRPLFPVEPSS